MTLSPPAGETSDTASQCMDLEPPWHDVIRGTGSGGHVAQGDPSNSVGADSGVKAQPSTSSRKMNVPLADQGIAFQHALQRCTGALSGLRGARSEQGGVGAAASRRHSKTREQRVVKKRRQREREGRRQGADTGQAG